jgi:hypothetical protein
VIVSSRLSELSIIASAGLKVGGLVMSILPELIRLFDGGATREEVLAFATKFSEGLDVKVRVKGADVLTPAIQTKQIEVVVELAFNIYEALRGGTDAAVV